jgi:hypothetical protein
MMERWSVQQPIFCVKQFLLSKSIVSVQREFRRKFGDDRQHGAAPSRKNCRSVGFVSGVRLDPYRLKPVPVETPSGHLKISSV